VQQKVKEISRLIKVKEISKKGRIMAMGVTRKNM